MEGEDIIRQQNTFGFGDALEFVVSIVDQPASELVSEAEFEFLSTA